MSQRKGGTTTIGSSAPTSMVTVLAYAASGSDTSGSNGALVRLVTYSMVVSSGLTIAVHPAENSACEQIASRPSMDRFSM